MAEAAPAVNLSERAAGCPSALPSLRFIAAESVLLAFQSNFLPQVDRREGACFENPAASKSATAGVVVWEEEGKEEGKVEGYISMRRQTAPRCFRKRRGQVQSSCHLLP